jgi:hypothetical protein
METSCPTTKPLLGRHILFRESFDSTGIVLNDFLYTAMMRLRRAIDSCREELGPLRHQIRNLRLRDYMLNWVLTGTIAYVAMYTIFYFYVHRETYGLGMATEDLRLLDYMYRSELHVCWYGSSNGTASNNHLLPDCNKSKTDILEPVSRVELEYLLLGTSGIPLVAQNKVSLSENNSATYVDRSVVYEIHRRVAHWRDSTSGIIKPRRPVFVLAPSRAIAATVDAETNLGAVSNEGKAPYNAQQHHAHMLFLDAGSCITASGSTSASTSTSTKERAVSSAAGGAPATLRTRAGAGAAAARDADQGQGKSLQAAGEGHSVYHGNMTISAASAAAGQHGARCLPSFIIAGAMKCGTGELMKWLQLHPRLRVGSGPKDKREVHFFTSPNSLSPTGTVVSIASAASASVVAAGADIGAGTIPDIGAGTIPAAATNLQSNATSLHLSSVNNSPSTASSFSVEQQIKELMEYAQFFPKFSMDEAATQYTFEKSPDYIRDKHALLRISSALPSMRMILLLRNPALRAMSEFSHHCRHGRYGRLTRAHTVTVTVTTTVSATVTATVTPAATVSAEAMYASIKDEADAEAAAVGSTNSVLLHGKKQSLLLPKGTIVRIDLPVLAAAAVVAATLGLSLVEPVTSEKTSAGSDGRDTPPEYFSPDAYAALHNPCSAADAEQYLSSREEKGIDTGKVLPAHSAVPEIEHGLYYSQLKNIYEM